MYKRKVTSVEPLKDRHGERETYKAKQSGKTIYKTVITFDNGSSGVFDHEGSVQSHFVVGQEAEFDAKDTPYGIKIYKPSQKKQGNRPAGWVPKSPGEVKRDNISFSGEKAVKLMIEAKAKIEEFPHYLEIIQGAVNAEVDKIEDE